MKKMIILTLIIIVVLTVVTSIRNEYTDRFNPFLREEVSYGKVPKGKQQYENVTAYSKEGEALSYKLNFTGYDETGEFVEIHHKGKYVRFIKYIKDDRPKFLK
ncbi:YxeA family protein [Staphylococcus hyicus]|uniref:YxeA family protein n=1 Tax=Staphylococcus hyicus TaxID=1284 RepID=A0ACD5FJ03_STAHY|nr:YxeA family protein [Staphylococcus hyicus]MDP4464219.1 YxeA family protein [Staphylococcus hyicus]PTJ71090.1 hypothetical protein BUZ58_07965 [Staphylococcus hyicus]PTJ87138.1 hypothetical protein BUZ56_09885 [Staphylococcus hyicus]